MSHTFRIGGIHPPENKLTASQPIVDVELPREVVVTFSQHIGAMAKCCRSKGEHVNRGDIIATAVGAVSANVHTPISGTIVKIDKWKTAFGYPADTVTIVADAADHDADVNGIQNRKVIRSKDELDALSCNEIVDIINDAGIVGLGGATFPTKVKLMPPPGMKADVLIINGVECEPYLTNDHALMLAYPLEIIEGVKLMMRAGDIRRAVIAIEKNKPDAIAIMQKCLADESGIEVMPLGVKYPQGGEKQLIDAVTRREVPSGGLPISVGVIVQNVATAHAVYNAAKYGMPLIERVVTVTGKSVKSPGNYRVPIGMSLRSVIDVAGGLPADTGKIILGGPMMGKAIVSIDAPTIKGVSGILIMPENEASRPDVEPCIRCGGCVDACPMGLEPYLLAILSQQKRWDDMDGEKVLNCIECGSCSYSCPAGRPLLDYIRLGKAKVSAIKRAKKS